MAGAWDAVHEKWSPDWRKMAAASVRLLAWMAQVGPSDAQMHHETTLLLHCLLCSVHVQRKACHLHCSMPLAS